MSTNRRPYSKQFFFGLFMLGALLLVVNLTRSMLEFRRVKERVDKAESQLREDQKNFEQLQETHAWSQSEDFVEQEIRNKLHMSRDAETVVMLPQSLSWSQVELQEGVEIFVEQRNWKRWWDVFFGDATEKSK